MIQTINHGLNPTLPDERDYQLWGLTSLPALSELPESFRLTPLSLENQGASDFCAGFASALLNGMEQGIIFSPEWQFAVAKMMDGAVESFGTDLRTILKSLKDYGSLPKDMAPYSLANKDSDFLRRIENWPQGLFRQAAIYRTKSFFEISGQYPSAYDNIRASIWKFRDQKQGVLSGLTWSWPITAEILDLPIGNNQGHCIPYIGWEKEGLVIQNSAGAEAGKNGIQIVTREVVDECVKTYKAFMFVDLSQEEAAHMLEHGIRLGDNEIIAFLKSIINVWLPFLNFWKNK